MDVQAFEEHAHSLFLAVSTQVEELQTRAVERLLDDVSTHHAAWTTEKSHLLDQLEQAKEELQAMDERWQRRVDEQTFEREEHALEISNLSSKLAACERKLQQADVSAAETSCQQANELAKISDQLRAALEYRRKCRSQQAEMKRLQEKIAGLQAEQQHASEQGMHADKQPVSQQSPKESQVRAGFLQKPTEASHVSVQPSCSQQIRAGAAEESQVASLQDDVVLDSQVDILLQRLQEAERRVQQEAQKRRSERKNVREVLHKKNDELKALKALSEYYRQQLIQRGALQEALIAEPRHCRMSLQGSGSNGLCIEQPQEGEATSRPAEGSARQGKQQVQQPRALSPAEVTPTACGGGCYPVPKESNLHTSACALKSVHIAGSGSCSRAASFEERQGRGSSPGKRAMPDAANANSAQQRATPAKRPKRDTCTAADQQRHDTGAGFAPGAKHAASAPAMQIKQERRPTAKPVEKPALASNRTLQPADVAHLQSAQNVRSSQDTDPGLPGSSVHPSDLTEEDLAHPERVGLLTQLLGPDRQAAQEEQKGCTDWKTKQRDSACPGALAFLDVAHVQYNRNPRICHRLPAIVDRHSPKGPQPLQGAGEADMHHSRPTDAGPGYRYKEVVRKKGDREAMLGIECPDCQRFYEACQTWNSIAPAALPKCGHAVPDPGQKAGVAAAPERVTRDQLRQNASRHRYHYAPPATPPGFWDMGFMDTQDSRNVGHKD